jgi:hypothetical protein
MILNIQEDAMKLRSKFKLIDPTKLPKFLKRLEQDVKNKKISRIDEKYEYLLELSSKL